MPDRMVASNLKPKGDCECGVDGCELYGTLGKPDKQGRRHVRGCKEFGCRVCLGRYSRTKGDRRATRARKALAIPGANSRHEELWGGALRVESKAGAQVKPAVTAFVKAQTQSEASRPVGDSRPFAAVLAADGSSDAVFACRLSDVFEVAAAVLENQAAAS